VDILKEFFLFWLVDAQGFFEYRRRQGVPLYKLEMFPSSGDNPAIIL
jgi:hypothetical protein